MSYKNTFIFFLLITFALAPFFANADQNLAPDYIPFRAGYQGIQTIRPADFDGSFKYSIPIEVPPGRNGLQPELSLDYSNNRKDNVNAFGYGWDINIPHIERINRKGTNNLYLEDFFFSALDGEATTTDAGNTNFGALIENGDFRKYEWVDNEHWKVTDKSGTVYRFGTTTGAQIVDPTDSSRVYRWMLEEVRDTNDNYISYSYYKDENFIYPSSIKYTGNGSTEGIFEVSFLRETRSDVASSSAPGFWIASEERVDEIQVKVDGTWVRKYEIAYTTGDNGDRSLISSITETGKDEGGTPISYPATTFTYSDSTDSWTYDNSWTMPAAFVGYDSVSQNRRDNGTRFGDFDGDGLVDIIQIHTDLSNSTSTVFFNDGDGSWTDITVNDVSGNYFSRKYGDDYGNRTVDYDGDGLTDISLDNGTPKQNLGNGKSFSSDGTYSNPVTFSKCSTYPAGCAWLGAYFMDLNGDGLADIAKKYDEDDPTHSADNGAYFNTGSDWVASTTLDLPFEISRTYDSQLGVDNGVRVADMNGDGLDDFVHMQWPSEESVDYKFIYFNDGNGGWETSEEITSVGQPFTLLNGSDTGLRLVDVNNDGLPDFVKTKSNSNLVYLNTDYGRSFTLDSSWSELPVDFICDNGPATCDGDGGSRFVDIDGDGLVDIIRSESSGTAYPPAGDNGAYLHDGVEPDILKRVTTKFGEVVDISYRKTAELTSGGESLNSSLPYNLTVVDTITRNDGFNNFATSTFSFEDGNFFYNSEFDRKFAGFATTTETGPLSNLTKRYFHTGSTTQSELGEYEDDVSKIGKQYREEIYDSSDNLFKTNITRWENVSLANNRDFVKATTTLELLYDGNSDHRDTAITFVFDDTNGNVATTTEYGEVFGETDGSFTDTGSDKRTTERTYAENTSSYILGLPSTETIKNNGGTTIAENKFYYDSLTLGNVNKGNLTKEEKLVEGSTYIDIERTYNSTYGTLTQEKDPRDKTTDFTYDSNNLYVITSTNAEGQVTSFDYDPPSGQVATTTDPNGYIFVNVFDGLGRPVAEKVPDPDSPATTVTKKSILYTDTVGERKILETNHLNYLPQNTNSSLASRVLNKFIKFTLNLFLGMPNEAYAQEENLGTSTPPILGTDQTLIKENPSVSDIRNLIKRKPLKDRATIKGQEISKLTSIKKAKRANYDIEVVEIEAIKDGVELFVRAWDSRGNQIGFGQDGSIDLERFVIINPPIMVNDPNGDVVREWIEDDEVKQKRLREDPKEAILQTLEHNLSIMKNVHVGTKIRPGKRGNTTTTVYPEAGTAGTTTDGDVRRTSTTGETWSNKRSGSGDAHTDTATTVKLIIKGTTSAWDELTRIITTFNTASIPDGNTINSASLTLSNAAVVTDAHSPSQTIVIALPSPASDSDLVNSDFNIANWTMTRQHDGSEDKAIPSASSNLTWTLNSTGIGNIDKTGISRFGAVWSGDIDNSEPGGSGESRVDFDSADVSGTAQDPKLVVEHSSGPPPQSSTSPFLLYKYFDGMDRVVQERKEMEDEDKYAVRDFVYDKRGDLSKETLPYRSTGSAKTSITTNSDLITTYTYDVLQRPKTAINVVGTESYSYDQWSATTTDREGNKRALINDAFGNLVQVNEDNSGSIYKTTYEYDILDNLTKITDALSNVRNFTYDSLSRLTKSEDLHDPLDTTFASTTYAYDDSGNKTSQLDQKNQRTNFTYDDINRVLTEDFTGEGGTEISYGYDWCSNGIGRLCNATTTSAVTKYEYNAHGLISKEIKEIGSSIYDTLFNYDWQGNKIKITYPDTSEVDYVYNTAGQLEQILYTEVGTTTQSTIIGDYDYHPSGQILYTQFGNNVETNFEYGTTTEYRIESIETATTTSMVKNSSFASNAFEKVLRFALNVVLGSAGEAHAQEEEIVEEISIPEPEIIIEPEVTEEVIDPPIEEPLEVQEEAPIEEIIENPEVIVDELPGEVIESNTSTTTESATPEIVDIVEEEPPLPQEETNPTDTELKTNTSTTTPESVIETPITTENNIESVNQIPPEEVRPEGIKIHDFIKDKPTKDRATLKGKEISKIGSTGRTGRSGYDIEIVEMNAIEGGVELFVRAWRANGEQIGFGSDGSVDLERFIIINPPIMVKDSNGDVIREWIDEDTGEIRQKRLREDPREAILQVLEHNLTIMKNVHSSSNIVTDKRGNTTTTVYSEASTGGTAVDGDVRRTSTSAETFSNKRGGVGESHTDTATTVKLIIRGTNGSWDEYTRIITTFDTSSIPDGDVISSATYTLSNAAIVTDVHTPSQDIAIALPSPASDNDLVNGDYDISNWTMTRQHDGSEDKAIPSSGADLTWTFNSTGIGNINKTGVSRFGAVWLSDIDNSEPTSGSGESRVDFDSADVSGTAQDPKLVIEHSAENSAPKAPTSLETESLTNPTEIADSTPEFSAIFNDVDLSDYVGSYQVQVATSSAYWGDPYWDSGTTTATASTTVATRTEQISYNGTSLASSTTYYWRIRLWDNSNAVGSWSTTTASFSLASTAMPDKVGYQNLTYFYDNVGNITQIRDYSFTDAFRRILFTYDDIYRLTSASTTLAQINAFNRTFAYDAIGNITNKSDQGDYTYSETGYANPNAVTDINGTSYGYDNNGNITSVGSTDYSWDYRNRLTEIDTGSATTTYEYDHENIRTKKDVDGEETVYANEYYNLTSATTTKHILGPNGETIATIEGNGVATSTYFVHNDHLAGSNIVTDSNGDLVQTLDYYPFGEQRVNTKAESFDEKRKFTGLEYDEDSDLHYASSRYYDQDIGRFTSQDPAFLLIGAPEFEQRYQRTLQQHLQNPQALNSYGYALNNPVRYTDPSGEIAPLIGAGAVAVIKASFDVATLALTGIAAYEAKTTIFDYPEQFTSQEKVVSGAKVVTFPGLRLFGSIFGTTQEKAAIDLLTNIAEITDIVSSAPDAVRDTYHSIQNQTRNFFNSGTGSTQTYTTPSGAVVDSGGRLISGPNNDDE